MVVNQRDRQQTRTDISLRIAAGLHSSAVCVLFLLKIVSLPPLCATITVSQQGVSSQGKVAKMSAVAVVVPREHHRLLAIAAEERLGDGDACEF